MGFTIVAASGCDADAGSIAVEASPPSTVDRYGHFEDSDGNTATIRVNTATGTFVGSDVCQGTSFRWTARRA
jgi:hypothetical protein